MSTFELDLDKIDETNLKCYDILAHEYDDVEHETCRDFDYCNKKFLNYAIKNDFKFINKLRYLDVGVGTGKAIEYLLDWLIKMNAQIEVLDISSKMLEITQEKFGNYIDKSHNLSIHNFKATNKYDLISAIMCDPYLTYKSIEIFKNSLTENGVLLLSFPSNSWAKIVRGKSITEAVFHNKNKEKHISYSFCMNKLDLNNLTKENNLIWRYSKLYLLDDKITETGYLSKINQALYNKEKRVPMLFTLIIYNKLNEHNL